MKNKLYILLLLGCINISANSQSLDWAISLGSAGSDIGRSIAFDSSGNLYTTGQFNNTIDFDPGINTYNLTSSGGQDIFVQKLDTNGNFIWAKKMGGNGPGSDEGFTIDIDGSGNIYVSGLFSGTSDFDPGLGVFNLTSAGSYDIFIVKLDSNGNFIWAKRMGGGTIGLNHDDRSYSMKVDSLGNVYTTGFFQSTPGDFDPNSGVFNMSSNGSLDVFISKLDTNGNFVWAKKIGGNGYDVANNITIDNNENIIITGYFEETVDFDPGSSIYNLSSNGGVFILKLNSLGEFIWVKTLSSNTSSSIQTLSGECSVVNNSNDIYVLGHYSDTVDFNPNAGVNNNTSNGQSDIFLLKLDNNGNFQWVKTFGGIQSEYGYGGLSFDSFENIYVSGVFSNTMDSDPSELVSNLNSNGQLDIFISKFNPNGNFLGSLSFGSSSTDYVEDIKVSNNGIFTTGIHYGITDFDPGSNEYYLTPGGVGAIFISKIETCFLSSNPIITLPPLTQTICSGSLITPIELTSSIASTTFNWTRNNNLNVTGIAEAGNGIVSGNLTNTTNEPIIVTFTITPSTNGCIGSQIITTVLVNPSATPIFTQVEAICAGSNIPELPITSTNNITGIWSPPINNEITTTYMFLPNAEQCAVSTTMTIEVNINSTAPLGDSIQSLPQGSTLSNLVVTGQNIQWYSTPFGGTPLSLNTTLVNGTSYYASQTINGCESQNRFPVIVQVNLSNDAFDSINVVYSPNPVVDLLLIKASTNLKSAKICNVLGQTILHQRFNSYEIQLDLSCIPTGTYFVTVESNNRKETFKILKNNIY